jgi:hypothetical protein
MQNAIARKLVRRRRRLVPRREPQPDCVEELAVANQDEWILDPADLAEAPF